MRLWLTVLILTLLAPLSAFAAPPAGNPTYQIVMPRRAVAAGEQLQLRLTPPPPPGAGVAWTVWLTANEGAGLPGGIYWAPYLIPEGTPPAKVTVRIRSGSTVSFATANIDLQPGSVPGIEGCLGPGQTFSPAAAGLTPSGLLYESGGYLVRSVDPVCPRSEFVRGVTDTIHVLALVCSTGHVLDAHYVPVYRPGGDDPFTPDPATLVENDPKLVDAAVAAVREYEFAPAIFEGHPVAFESFETVLVGPTSTPETLNASRLRDSVSLSPNPMNPAGSLTFATFTPGRILVTLYDIQGRRVRTMLDLLGAPPGVRVVRVGDSDGRTGRLATGIYFYRIETPDGEASGRIAVLK